MAGLSIKLDVTGYLKRFAERVGRLEGTSWKKELAGRLGNVLSNSAQDRFDTNIDPEGRAWKPSKRVLGAKGKNGKPGGRTLTDTGRLKGSIHATAYEDRVEVVTGTDVEYARIHQLGGDAGRNHATKLPARPYLGMSAEDERIVHAVVEGFIEEMLG